MNHKEMNLTSEELAGLRNKALSARICTLCSRFYNCKNVRAQTPLLCPQCESKRPLLKRYMGGDGLTEEVRQKVASSSTTRSGPFWNPKAAPVKNLTGTNHG